MVLSLLFCSQAYEAIGVYTIDAEADGAELEDEEEEEEKEDVEEEEDDEEDDEEEEVEEDEEDEVEEEDEDEEEDEGIDGKGAVDVPADFPSASTADEVELEATTTAGLSVVWNIPFRRYSWTEGRDERFSNSCNSAISAEHVDSQRRTKADVLGLKRESFNSLQLCGQICTSWHEWLLTHLPHQTSPCRTNRIDTHGGA